MFGTAKPRLPQQTTTHLPSNIKGELRNWYAVGKMYHGAIYGDKRFKDGKEIYTDYIKEIIDKPNEDWIIVVTNHGSRFLCWRNQHHRTKQDVAL